MNIKMINKKLKKILHKNLFLLIFIMLLLVSFNFFQNFFHLIKYDKNERLIKNSQFCGGDSQGFIVHLTKNYNFKKRWFIDRYGYSSCEYKWNYIIKLFFA